ncbi:fasciclin domain-containing protein [Salegentibacter flavus]|uniref:Uncaracterized surface protein containing fasciclin (FAS1) repeats n=1 Tax=Salegentibacter flavus TaxID=287099 RepID=A0A1I4XV34_9FLAO|nr:fasciclin domain-containing protein [Salegentibacter flavus]SFN29684.1 Uncaracterized surface protein containing fasciclin (FAS1) repeats [Salegentibacter flavus]
MKISKILVILFLGLFVFTSCEDGKKKAEEEKERLERQEAERAAGLQAEEERMEWEANSIAAKTMEDDSLSSLSSALQNAELAQTFTEEEGPYTIFAPTNEAFEKVDRATLDTLMKTENREKLSDVLKYHVVEDEITAEELSERIDEGNGEYSITTLSGASLNALKSGDDILLKDENGNTSKIIKTNIEASNGVIHQIDGVMMRKKS